MGSVSWPVGCSPAIERVKNQPPELSGAQLFELLQRVRVIRKQIEPGWLIAPNDDGPVMNPIVKPMAGDIQGPGQLWERKKAGNVARMGLAAFDKEPMLQADAFNRTG